MERDGAGKRSMHSPATKRRISAIMPVHVLGNMCDMPRLLQISSKHRISIVEDATEALALIILIYMLVHSD